jgi:hypothetical protein
MRTLLFMSVMILLAINDNECWKGISGVGTSTALATACGDAAPVKTQACTDGDDKCWTMRVECSLMTDADDKTLACATDAMYLFAVGCGKGATDFATFCNTDDTFGLPAGYATATDTTKLAPTAGSMEGKCCASTTPDCNAPHKCLVGATGMGTSKFYVDLTGSAAPVSQYCKFGDDKCFRIVIDCQKETDATKRVVLCAATDTTTAMAWGCAESDAASVCTDNAVNNGGGTT